MFNLFRRSADPIAMGASQSPTNHPPEQKASRPLLASHFPRSSSGPSYNYAALCREGFARNPIAHRCVRLIAESAASVPLRSSDARVARLLSRGLPNRSAVETLESFYGYLQLGGDAFLETVLSGERWSCITAVVFGPRRCWRTQPVQAGRWCMTLPRASA